MMMEMIITSGCDTTFLIRGWREERERERWEKEDEVKRVANMWERNESFFGVASPSSSKTKFVSFVSFPRYTEPIINSLLSRHTLFATIFFTFFPLLSFFYFFRNKILPREWWWLNTKLSTNPSSLSHHLNWNSNLFSLQLVLLLLADRSIKGGDFFYFVLRQRWFQAVISSSQVSLASHFAV